MTLTDWIQAISTVVLVVVTIVLVAVTVAYVKRTAEIAEATEKQAEASVKMAQEMRNTRYDALRPIVDIGNINQIPWKLASQAYAKEPPKELTCILHNVGVGPAIGVYVFVCPSSGERRIHNFGTIPVGRESYKVDLSLGQKGDRWFLVAYYKDVYGRWFESSREVRIGVVIPDPLQIREIAEEELPK